MYPTQCAPPPQLGGCIQHTLLHRHHCVDVSNTLCSTANIVWVYPTHYAPPPPLCGCIQHTLLHRYIVWVYPTHCALPPPLCGCTQHTLLHCLHWLDNKLFSIVPSGALPPCALATRCLDTHEYNH